MEAHDESVPNKINEFKNSGFDVEVKERVEDQKSRRREAVSAEDPCQMQEQNRRYQRETSKKKGNPQTRKINKRRTSKTENWDNFLQGVEVNQNKHL